MMRRASGIFGGMLAKMRWFLAAGFLCVPGALFAQWKLQDAHTMASLRGIHSLGGGVAWASGTDGTVLRTEDGGANWEKCAVPPGAEKLDFRGVQGFDAKTAIVMSSGKGDLSRLYKTVDGCQNWKLVFTNPDAEGFWDAVKFVNSKLGFVLGDPVTYAAYKRTAFTGFALFATEDGGTHFKRRTLEANKADPATHGAFAASNTSLFVGWPYLYFGSGGMAGPRVYLNAFQQHISYSDHRITIESGDWHSNSWRTPLATGEAAGIFSLSFKKEEHAVKEALSTADPVSLVGIAVGGDYSRPTEIAGTAAYTDDGGQHWLEPDQLPHGYRSAVTYDETAKAWIAVGPNGTDVSFDDGRNWVALKGEAGEDRDWNALSLPFVVGPKGRIGKLKVGALKK